jgi:N-acetylglucosamine-6-phosphate deacetylase
VHLEGPFLSPGKVGAQNPEHLLSPDVELLLAWQQLAAGKIKLVTLAPELDKGLALTKVLQQQGIIAAIGHTEADYHCAKQAIDAGACHATHLFNAMPQLHHRRPGATAALLLDDRVTAELIVDHHHVHPAMVDLAIKAKGFEGLVLVSDAMRAQCLGDGVYDLGGQQVTVEAGQARLTNGALAGSVVTLGQAVKNICQRPDYDLTNALTMAAANPAKQLGIFHRKGSLAIGKDADLVIINKAGEVVFTLCRGVIAVDRL